METLTDYLTKLASESPTPGGGSAATIVGASGAALVSMVGRICAGSKKYAAQKDFALDLVARADALRESFLSARTADEEAFERVMSAMAMPKVTDEEKEQRASALQSSLRLAAAEPLRVCEMGLEVLSLANQALLIPNRNLVSDVGCAAEFGAACVAAAAHNVRINHCFMTNSEDIENQEHIVVHYEHTAAGLLESARRGVMSQMLG